MTLAASLDGNLIFYIAAAAYGVFAWWNDRRQKKAAEEEAARTASQRPQNPQTQQRPAIQGGESSEQERMRKFLEALGVPSGPQAPTQPRPQPAPLRPPAAPASPTLAPRPVAMPLPRPMMRPQSQPAAKAYVPPPAPKPRPVIVDEPLPAESRDPGRLEGAATSIESVSTEFARMHDRPMAVPTDPSIAIAAAGNAPMTSVLPQVMFAQGRILRELLRNPESVRAAIVVSEVLGPPKGA